MSFKPTSEQQAIFDAAVAGLSLVIQALAGAGKTSSLEMLTHRLPGKGIYLTFNRSIALEAKQRFAKHVLCSTVHGLAFREEGSSSLLASRVGKTASFLRCACCNITVWPHSVHSRR